MPVSFNNKKLIKEMAQRAWEQGKTLRIRDVARSTGINPKTFTTLINSIKKDGDVWIDHVLVGKKATPSTSKNNQNPDLKPKPSNLKLLKDYLDDKGLRRVPVTREKAAAELGMDFGTLDRTYKRLDDMGFVDYGFVDERKLWR